MPRKSPALLVAHVIATMAYVAHAFELAIDLDPELTPEDHAILLDQVDAAGRHLADVIWALHPQWRDLDQRAAESKALHLFREHRPDIDETRRGLDATLDALHSGVDEALAGAIEARTHGPQRRYRDVATELDFAADHLENALYLLDPESFRVAMDATTPTQRVKLASRLEVIELELEEHRAMLRKSGEFRLGAEMN
jgi:hypothetical protein